MTPKERLTQFTEDTKISLGVILIIGGFLAGGVTWLTSISIQANQAVESSHRIEQKQDAYAEELAVIHLSLQEITGELKRIKR